MQVHADQAGFEQLRDWLSRRCGITFGPSRANLLRQRMERVLRRFDLPDLNHLARELDRASAQDLQLAVLHAASINHTYFFREIEVLDNFMDLALPELKERPEFRFWSAACSSGEEAYTLGIMLAERLGSGALSRTHILGTDISEPVVERAELGIYSARQFSQTDPARVKRWFEPAGLDQYRVAPELRRACTFRRMNLKATPYPFNRPFQAVFCRNVLYYFDRADQVATVNALYDVVEPGGWLITSVTESVRQLGTLWEPVATGLYRRRS